jgi:hypothetical protein
MKSNDLYKIESKQFVTENKRTHGDNIAAIILLLWIGVIIFVISFLLS